MKSWGWLFVKWFISAQRTWTMGVIPSGKSLSLMRSPYQIKCYYICSASVQLMNSNSTLLQLFMMSGPCWHCIHVIMPSSRNTLWSEVADDSSDSSTPDCLLFHCAVCMRIGGDRKYVYTTTTYLNPLASACVGCQVQEQGWDCHFVCICTYHPYTDLYNVMFCP